MSTYKEVCVFHVTHWQKNHEQIQFLPVGCFERIVCE